MQHASAKWSKGQIEAYILGFCASKNNGFDGVRYNAALKKLREAFLLGGYGMVSKKDEELKVV